MSQTPEVAACAVVAGEATTIATPATTAAAKIAAAVRRRPLFHLMVSSLFRWASPTGPGPPLIRGGAGPRQDGGAVRGEAAGGAYWTGPSVSVNKPCNTHMTTMQ